MIIDRKYKFVAVNPCSGEAHTEEDAVLFLARDKFLPKLLKYYYDLCWKDAEVDVNHLKSITLLKDRVLEYHEEHERKNPDTNRECEIKRCIDGEV